jgi:ATP-binding protein involved in chromosome partitioning
MPKSYKDLIGDGGSNIVGQVQEQVERLRARLEQIQAIVAVVSGKGGVGKSLLTVNLAAAAAMLGKRVGILDADLNGPCIAKMAGVREQRLVITADGVHPAQGPGGMRILSMDLLLPNDDTPVTWRSLAPSDTYLWRSSIEASALREFLSDTLWGELDILFLDLAPGTDRIATLSGLLPSLTGIILITIPSEVSHLVVRKSLVLARALQVTTLGLIENMSGYECPCCHTVGELFKPGQGPLLAREFGIPFLGAIPFDPRLARSGDSGIPFVAMHAECTTSQILQGIAQKLMVGLEGGERRIQ